MLKLDPKNTELLAQKQEVLNKNISTTEDKLKQLNDIKNKADIAMSKGTEINEENYRTLQREIINTQNKLVDLKNEASNWTKAGDALIKWGENLDKVGQKINSLGSKLTTSLTLPITALGTAGITYDAQIEKYETAFKTFLGSAEKAKEAIKNIKDDAKKTPFDTTSLVRANQMLISTGVEADKAREDILALGEAVIATGGGNDELTRMASNLQQIKNAGKATAMDIRQFAYAGIDVYGILADSLGKTTEEIKDMEISYDDLTIALKKAGSEGGKYFGAMSNSSETLVGQVSALKSEVQDGVGELTKSLMPVAKKLVKEAREWIKKLDQLSDTQKENIVKMGLMVAAAGPLLKIGGNAISIIGNVSKGLGTLSKAISLAHNGIGTATGSAATLAKVLQGLSSPMGLAAVGITASVALIVNAMNDMQKDAKEAFSNMGNSASDFISGIDSAQSHLGAFNSELFVSSQKQKELENQMKEVQEGITKICKTASEERRNYTQEEVTQLDEYFEKLRELNQREIEIQQSIAGAITQQATQNAATFKGTLEEYKVQSQEWLKTAEEQKNKTLELVNSQTIEEVALLNTRYSTEEAKQTEAYRLEYEKIMQHKEEKIAAANDEIAKINQAYSNGYLERTKENDGFFDKLKEFTDKQERLQESHNKKIEQIKNDELWYVTDKNGEIRNENEIFAFHQQEIWNKLYKDMDKSQEEQLGTWLAMVAQTEMYGGEIDEETRKTVDSILASYNSMPKGTKEAMKNAMEPMLEEMQNKEPSLFAKATGIADGILTRLKKSFDIHSPSRKTRDIFQNVMKGAELGLEDEKGRLNKEIENIASQIQTDFNNIVPNMQGIKQSVIDKTKTVFTTPNIVFNVQKMDEANLNTAFNYVNKRLGSQY